MILIYIKQHLSNIWSSIHEKVNQHQGSIEKRALVLKKARIPAVWKSKAFKRPKKSSIMSEDK